MIAFACSHCGRVLSVTDDQAGKEISCPRCGQVSNLPNPVVASMPADSDAATLAPVAPQPAAVEETVDLPKPNLAGAAAESPTLAPTEAHPPLTAGPPARIDIPGYEMLGELGRGGMGIIYKARQLQPRRLVALKMILAGEYADADALARFHREAEAVARLTHPNIVQIHQVCEHEGRPYFCLELVEGGNLAQRLGGKRYDFRAAAELVLALARAIQFAHDHGIIHRDLKPANILLSSDGTPKITDFGLAKQIEGSMAPAAKTQSGAILGTPSYMAPEQAEGKSKNIGRPADIYALGAILYELLARRPPFQAETTIDTLMKVATEEPVPPRKVRKKCPRDLETICLKCLRKNPSQRYASAGDLADDLRRWLDGEAIKARPTGKIERVRRFLGRHKAPVFLVIGCAIPTFLMLSFCIFSMFLGLWMSSHVLESMQHQVRAQNLEQLKGAMYKFHGTHHCLPPAAITDRKTGKPLLSWRVAILPFLNEEALYKKFKLDEPWDGPNNIKLLPQMPNVFRFSHVIGAQRNSDCFFQVFVGPGTAFEPQGKPHAEFGRAGLSLSDDFPDGSANTILIVEAAEGVPWTKPVDLPYDPHLPLPKLGGAFPEGILVSMADGSGPARFIKHGVSEHTLRALITRNDGQDPGNDW